MKTVVEVWIDERRHLLESFIDISDLRRIESDLPRAKEVVEAARAANIRFLASMSHEICAPMNGVFGMIELSLGAGLTSVRLEVSDTGIGIGEEDQEIAFDSFSQADAQPTRKHGDTGVGLAICRQLTEKMNGEIGVRSEPQRGSTFWVTIPFRTVVVRPTGAASRATAKMSIRRMRSFMRMFSWQKTTPSFVKSQLE